jgi:dGTPase
LAYERSDRRYALPAPDGSRFSPFTRDRDVLLRSAAFQRLRHVTQVMAVGESGDYHNRLTHSLAVARIGHALADALLAQQDSKALAEAAGGLDPVVVEAACLAHDLGHPPFAHVAEAELNRLLTEAGVADGFEANAQAFRVVCTLLNDGAGTTGLNLTRATLGAILKYPWLRNGSPEHPRKWGAYASEVVNLAWSRAHLPLDDCQPTLEAEVMDWADLVAYAAFDFEDFVRAGAIPVGHLAGDAAERDRFLALVFARRRIPKSDQARFETILAQVLRDCPNQPLPVSRASRNALRCFVNHQIDQASGGVTLSPGVNGHPTLNVDPNVKAQILLLEGLTWHYVIDSDLLVPQRDAQRQIIRSLFEYLAEAATSGRNLYGLAGTFEERIKEAENEPYRLRIISDYLASLTEAEAIELRRNLVNPAS